jgi:predicted hydrocarbon binding protein
MHGTIFAELQKYVVTKLGPPAWPALLTEAGLAGRAYDALEEYPDAEAGQLVAAASRLTGNEAGAILEDFGEFIAPDLLEMYWGVVRPEWRTLDVVEHTERAVHEVVRLQNPGARPPYLEATRTSPDEVLVKYTSPRRMCAVAVGIVRGLARHFGESVDVEQATCMHRGDASCLIRVRKREA